MRSIVTHTAGHTWGMNIFGFLPLSTAGKRYIVVMIDHFTRWVEAIPTVDQTSETVTRVFVDNIIARFGVPQRVITDQCPCFESRRFQEMLRNWGIQRLRTSPYHPQTNGLTERFNHTMKEWLNSAGGKWEDGLAEVLLGYRTTAQSTTQISSFELTYVRKPRVPLDVFVSRDCESHSSPEERQELEQQAITRTTQRQQRNQTRYDEQQSAQMAPLRSRRPGQSTGQQSTARG